LGWAGRPEDGFLLGADNKMGVSDRIEHLYLLGNCSASVRYTSTNSTSVLLQSLVTAGLADLARPADKLSTPQSAALALTGTLVAICKPLKNGGI
jgi:hypothetical protein